MLILLLTACSCATPEAPGPDPDEDTEQLRESDSGGDTGSDCALVLDDQGRMVIDDCWWVIAEDEELHELARTVAAGELLLGCEDPAPPWSFSDDEPGGPRPGLVLELNPDLPEQGYRVTPTELGVRLEGGSQRGLVYGLLDWQASLDEVLTDQGSWAPDPRSGLATSCIEGASVQELRWSPEEAEGAPDIALRMAFASFKGSQNAHFIPTLVYNGVGRCSSPEATEEFWEALRSCDIEQTDEEGYTPCLESRLRLDSLIRGRFTHALDEGAPIWLSDSVQLDNGCSGSRLYQELDDYLALRGVQLVPTAFGLETRTPDTPVGGRRITPEEPSELWGVEGDATLSEGLRMTETMTVCAGAVLAADCSTLDEDGLVTGPLRLGEPLDGSEVPGLTSTCGELELCLVKEGCWESQLDGDEAVLAPSADCSNGNPLLRMALPTDGRWYLLHARASALDNGQLTFKLVVKDQAGVTNTHEVELLSTLAEEGEYLFPSPAQTPGAPDVVHLSYTMRAPLEHDRLDTAYLQIYGEPGAQAWIDDVWVEPLGVRLPNVDGESLTGAECLSIEGAVEAPLPVASVIDGAGAIQAQLARVTADCLDEGDTVELGFRSWTHAGLWPGVVTRQKSYTYAPDVDSERFWDHAWSPTAQLDALDEVGDLVLVSDLGGEVRGLGRHELSTEEALVAFHQRLVEASRGARLLVAADMYMPWHNGGDSEGGVPGRHGYQVPFGGEWGDSWTARRGFPEETLFVAWWHYDTRRAGSPVGGVETALGFVEDLARDGLDSVGVSAWDPDNARHWAAMAASGQTAGVGHYGWGTDLQAPRILLQAGRIFWQPGWRHLDSWTMSDDPDLPGGDETSTVAIVGMRHADSSELSWPRVGRWLEIEEDEASWTAPLPVHEDALLVRVHLQAPEGCAVHIGEASLAPDASDYRAWGMRLEPSTGELLELSLKGCAGGVLDTVSVYEASPVSDFPHPRSLEHLDAWDSVDSADARMKICGDESADCVNTSSWGD
jgi:hypothetical protein